MNLLNNIIITFFMSSILVCLIILLFVIWDKKINITNSNFIKSLLILSIIHSIMLNILPKVIFPFIFILYSSLIIAIIMNINLKKSLWSVTKLFLIILVFEIIIGIILDTFFKFNTQNLSINLHNLLITLPIKFIELILFFIFKRRDTHGILDIFRQREKGKEK